MAIENVNRSSSTSSFCNQNVALSPPTWSIPTSKPESSDKRCTGSDECVEPEAVVEDAAAAAAVIDDNPDDKDDDKSSLICCEKLTANGVAKRHMIAVLSSFIFQLSKMAVNGRSVIKSHGRIRKSSLNLSFKESKAGTVPL